MTYHMMVQTGKRLYSCDICSEQFIQAQYETSPSSSYWRDTVFLMHLFTQCINAKCKKFGRRFILERVYKRVTFVVKSSVELGERKSHDVLNQRNPVFFE